MGDFLFGAVLTALGIAVGALTSMPSLKYAQKQYQECIALQAPEQVCVKEYLLPKEKP